MSDKTAEIVAAFQSADPLVKDYIVIITGDLAFLERCPKYSKAMEFLDGLVGFLMALIARVASRSVSRPAIDDCDFEKDTKVRQLVLDAVTSGKKDLNDGDDMLCNLLAVQGDFFYVEVYARRKAAPGDPQGWASLSTVVHVGDRRVIINAYSCSYFKPRHRGQLRLPRKRSKLAVLTRAEERVHL